MIRFGDRWNAVPGLIWLMGMLLRLLVNVPDAGPLNDGRPRWELPLGPAPGQGAAVGAGA
ncbi:hypothetical protein GCM10009869_12690 [Amnibacterium kyonggiense]